MKRILFLAGLFLTGSLSLYAVDMQAHMGTGEAQDAYTLYLSKQADYYTNNYADSTLRAQEGDELFGALNALMGATCQLNQSRFSYNSLRSEYKNVDKDLNTPGNIIGYYDGCTLNGTWDGGSTWNREHTWPQSKGADKSIAMGHDMQSVRPTSTAVNSDRGNTAYGESSNYYDPNEVRINNSLYVNTNMGSYRGDAARVIMYDYIVYGKVGNYQNSLYNGNAQLLSKLGTSGVFESLAILIKWHMNDPVSLTEMVRNDGAEAYQGNRNPFIDYPELAIQLFKGNSGVSTYTVRTTGTAMWPAYRYTLRDGFVAYLGTPDNRPAEVTVTGATATYDNTNGRLIVRNVTGAVTITCPTGTALEMTQEERKAVKVIRHGQILILKHGKAFTTLGVPVAGVE